MKRKAILFTIIFMLPTYVMAADVKSEKGKFSYAVGFQIGQSLKRDQLDVDIKTLNDAIADVLGDKKIQLTAPEMQAAIQAFQQKAVEQRNAAADKNKKDGEKYLADNKKKKGVKETKSGLQYKIIKAGSGKSPNEKDTVVVNYRGTLTDGTEFDSSYKRGQPATFQVGQVIKGWQEAIQLMKTGAKWEVYIPSDLGYGPNGAGGKIGPNAALVFEVELLEIKQSKTN